MKNGGLSNLVPSYFFILLIYQTKPMAFTRNKNTQGNYNMEQMQLQRQFNMSMYQHSSSGISNHSWFGGRGLLQGRMPSNLLANNATDIESDLRGIGSTNLVQKYIPPVPQIHQPTFLDIYKQPKIIVPKPFSHNPNERPQFH
jgi:hypothetical protein